MSNSNDLLSEDRTAKSPNYRPRESRIAVSAPFELHSRRLQGELQAFTVLKPVWVIPVYETSTELVEFSHQLRAAFPDLTQKRLNFRGCGRIDGRLVCLDHQFVDRSKIGFRFKDMLFNKTVYALHGFFHGRECVAFSRSCGSGNCVSRLQYSQIRLVQA